MPSAQTRAVTLGSSCGTGSADPRGWSATPRRAHPRLVEHRGQRVVVVAGQVDVDLGDLAPVWPAAAPACRSVRRRSPTCPDRSARRRGLAPPRPLGRRSQPGGSARHFCGPAAAEPSPAAIPRCGGPSPRCGPSVTSLKRARSSGTSPGNVAAAADDAGRRLSPDQAHVARSYSDGGFDRGVRIVVLDDDIVVGVVEDRIPLRQNQFRVRPRVATQLLG